MSAAQHPLEGPRVSPRTSLVLGQLDRLSEARGAEHRRMARAWRGAADGW